MTYSNHPEAVRIREWRLRNPDRNKANRARYRLKHRKRLAADQRDRAALNREGELARVVAWQQANPERLAAYQTGRVEMKADALEQKAGRARPDVWNAAASRTRRASASPSTIATTRAIFADGSATAATSRSVW